MMNRTTIDWPELTHSINPATGCLNNCYYCYARKVHEKRRKTYRSDPEKYKMFKRYANPFNQINYYPQTWKGISKTTKTKRKIFVGSMTDISFWEKDFVDYTIDCCKIYKYEYMFLTKDPTFYQKYVWFDKCQLGVTITSQDELWKADIIAKLPYKTFVSIEPLMGKIEYNFPGIDLLIIGQMTGKNHIKIKKEWLEGIKHDNIYYKKSVPENVRCITSQK